jgi:carbohydrate-binding DOMON domain-containing protein
MIHSVCQCTHTQTHTHKHTHTHIHTHTLCGGTLHKHTVTHTHTHTHTQYIAPDSSSSTQSLAKYGKDFWVGRVTNVFDATKGTTHNSNRWARNEEGEHYDFEV